MKYVAVPRKDLGVRTVFNFLGPLANPAGVRRQAVGVAVAKIAPLMAQVLAELGHERALVFHSQDGLDELSTVATSHVWELRDGKIREHDIDAAALGLDRAQAADIKGGDAAANAAIVTGVLDGEPGAHRDIVLLNAAAGLVAAGRADEVAAALELARESIDSGAAHRTLGELRAATSALAAPA
jgi:anthranilate phosphoribosyltransferase